MINLERDITLVDIGKRVSLFEKGILSERELVWQALDLVAHDNRIDLARQLNQLLPVSVRPELKSAIETIRQPDFQYKVSWVNRVQAEEMLRQFANSYDDGES